MASQADLSNETISIGCTRTITALVATFLRSPIPDQTKIIRVATLIIFIAINIPIFLSKTVLIAALIILVATNIPIILQLIILVVTNIAIAPTPIAPTPQNHLPS